MNEERTLILEMLSAGKITIQKLAGELNVAYNTARNHLDDIVAALENPPSGPIKHPDRLKILTVLSAGEISFESAMKLLADL